MRLTDADSQVLLEISRAVKPIITVFQKGVTSSSISMWAKFINKVN